MAKNKKENNSYETAEKNARTSRANGELITPKEKTSFGNLMTTELAPDFHQS